MVTEEEETRGSIADTIAQLASNYKVAEASEKAKLEKEAVTQNERRMQATMASFQVASDLFTAIGDLQEEGSKEQKSMMVAAATVQALMGALAAYTSAAQTPIVGPVLAPIAAAVALAAGMANVKKIKQTPERMSTGGIIYGHGTQTSDNIPIMASPGEAVINARSLQANEVMNVTGTPREIASEINSFKGFGRKFAAGGMVTDIRPNSVINNQFDKSVLKEIVQETVEGVTHIPVTLVPDHVTKAQRLTEIAENQGNI